MFGQALKHRVSVTGVIKYGKGVLLGWVLHNSSFAEQSISFYDREGLPDRIDQAIDWPLLLAPDETSTVEFAMGIPFYHGISYGQWDPGTRVLHLAAPINGLLLFA